MSARKKVLLSKLSARFRELAEPNAERRVCSLEFLWGMSDVMTREFAIVSPFDAGLGEQPVLALLAEVIARYDAKDRSTEELTLLGELLCKVHSGLISTDPAYAELSAQRACIEEVLDDELGFEFGPGAGFIE